MTMLEPDRKEVLDRVRRIETRLTNYLEAQGFDTGATKPTWYGGVVHVPNLSCGLKDIFNVVPQDWPRDRPVVVTLKGSRCCAILLTQRKD